MLVTFAWICVAIVAATTDIIRFLCKRVLRSRNISNEPLDDSWAIHCTDYSIDYTKCSWNDTYVSWCV